jgi:autotransporter-associated beta strand protein
LLVIALGVVVTLLGPLANAQHINRADREKLLEEKREAILEKDFHLTLDLGLVHGTSLTSQSTLSEGLQLAAQPDAITASFTWTGGGGNVNWSTPNNWGGTAPTSANTTDLIFAGTTNVGTSGTPLNNNIASPMLLNSITFSSGGSAFFLGGNALAFTGTSNSITQNSSSAESIANSFTPSDNQIDTIMLTGNGTGVVTLSGAITNGNGNRDYAITKSGTSTFVLSGANTYTGATTVNGGKLLVNGSLASGSAVTVNNSGSILGGTGTVNGTVNIGSGAAILGGIGATASGTLTVANNLTLSSGSIIELALGASGAHSTLTRSAGTWSFQAAQQFTFIDLGATTGNYNNIITGLASNPGTGSWTITDPGWTGTFTYSGGNISLNLTAVPEPSTWIGGALAVLAIGCTQRNRFVRLLKRA